VREEVALGKRQVQDTQHVTDTVRREEARVERQGDVNIQGQDVDLDTDQQGS
jgi:stress response protein YsnF